MRKFAPIAACVVLVAALCVAMLPRGEVNAQRIDPEAQRLYILTPENENKVWLITKLEYDDSQRMYRASMQGGSEMLLSPAVPFRVLPSS